MESMSKGSLQSPIPRKRVSVICVFEDKILCFVGVDPKSAKRYYFLPGGSIESGESEVTCGERETLEETGYRVRVEAATKITKQYNFFWNGLYYGCITHFYRAHLNEVFHPPKIVQDADYNKGPVWMPAGKAKAIFDYTPEILQAVLKLIDD